MIDETIVQVPKLTLPHYVELHDVLSATKDAFDYTLCGHAAFHEASVESRFRLRTIRNLALAWLQQAIETQTLGAATSVDEITRFVFEALRMCNVSVL